MGELPAAALGAGVGEMQWGCTSSMSWGWGWGWDGMVWGRAWPGLGLDPGCSDAGGGLGQDLD